jgi:nucleoside-diphosphate-sugar epimerase
LNVLRQAEKAGVKKFVVTSSIITMTGDPTVKGAAYRSERRLFLSCFDLGSVTYSLLQIGVQ